MRFVVSVALALWILIGTGVLLSRGDGAGLEAAWPGISARLGLFERPASEGP